MSDEDCTCYLFRADDDPLWHGSLCESRSKTADRLAAAEARASAAEARLAGLRAAVAGWRAVRRVRLASRAQPRFAAWLESLPDLAAAEHLTDILAEHEATP